MDLKGSDGFLVSISNDLKLLRYRKVASKYDSFLFMSYAILIQTPSQWRLFSSEYWSSISTFEPQTLEEWTIMSKFLHAYNLSANRYFVSDIYLSELSESMNDCGKMCFRSQVLSTDGWHVHIKLPACLGSVFIKPTHWASPYHMLNMGVMLWSLQKQKCIEVHRGSHMQTWTCYQEHITSKHKTELAEAYIFGKGTKENHPDDLTWFTMMGSYYAAFKHQQNDNIAGIVTA